MSGAAAVRPPEARRTIAAMTSVEAAPPAGPLAGIRVVDCSTVLAGPYCTMLLGDLGADVVKVEPPEGDATRGWGPPWVGDETSGTRTAAYYLAINRNKRSIRLDLRSEEGRGVLRALLRAGDIVVENFRVGGFQRLGFSDASLRELNPSLIHLAISGYGTAGPDAMRPGYDFVIQAVSGLMSITGEPDGEPLKVGVAISDVATGLFGAVSILAALFARVGQRIDVSLLGSTLALLVNQAQSMLVTGTSPARLGNAHPSIVPYEMFATADGQVTVGVGSERQWHRLCAALGLPGLASDARFATNGDRVEHRAELIPILADRFAERSTAACLGLLEEAGIPAGPILGIREAFETPQAEALRARVPLGHARLGVVDQVGIPFTLSSTPAAIRSAPPMLGEHTAEILAEAGYDEAAIDRLVELGVV
jgi:crotonobetainyl-CoA:carnitine CoA-transferase CaiB-like acyl-CoA transferase